MNKEQNTPPRILISGGGTGGHIFPAIAIANAIRRQCRQAQILFVGAKGRMEMERVPAAGYEIKGLPVSGFDRKNPFKNFKVILKLIASYLSAHKIVGEFAPDVVIGVGGYASGPVLKAAQIRKIPTLLQEQNSYAGVTNKLLASKAKTICVAYENMEKFFPKEKIVLTGNPIRQDIIATDITREAAKRQLGFPDDRPLIFVTGGSLGAVTINESVARALPTLAHKNISLLWQTGKRYAHECETVAAPLSGVVATPFVAKMAIAYRAADIVIARAGACTISELQIVGAPTILIPSPNVAEDHQRKNAQALVNKNAAIMILDKDARENLTSAIISLLDNKQLRDSLSENISAMALTDADTTIADLILNKLIKKNNN